MKAILAVLVVLAIVEAGALAFVLQDRSRGSNELQAQTQKAEAYQYLVGVASDLQDELSRMDRATSAAAAVIYGGPLNSSRARSALNVLTNASSNIINVLTMDRNGTVAAVAPAQYGYMEGMNIGTEEPVEQLLDHGQPVISPLIAVVEGYDAVFIAYPVLDEQGTVVGAVSTLFRPDWTMENITGAQGSGIISAMVMQDDGVVLYDPDVAQVGRNTFTDPLYQNFTEIKVVASRMVNESSGSDSYSFQLPGGTEEVHKTVVWTAVGLLGERWTVAVNRAA